ncbi:phosphomannomutase/phosphoglucomutase [Cryobacterium melibiosiphilum]|uniref:Phosphomannomutase/phosphoglucomutase n=1 Tax=Cryobacterium melibiosiphilum TaxID=995039 RepID=A0A3A5MCI1_9MICO|nr:phosphomannomutase/phosphoglucomutase [Cryobacterium melibiosiphilum]RJT87837.1 phosphomannomutase/phosphoglucomutase [Cryobacterium melibiosiphilum]
MSSSQEALAHLSLVVGSYDVRGLVGAELTAPLVRALGAAFADEVATPGGQAAEIAIGQDMRESSAEFAEAFADGAEARGASIVMLGLCSTDETYFVSGRDVVPAVMITASHNPAEYNGLKFSRAGAVSMSADTGLSAVRDRAAGYLADGIEPVASPGSRRHADVLPAYAAHLRSLVDLTPLSPLRVVVDAGNGMAGLTVPAVLGDAAGLAALPIEVIPLYFELDGTFPHRAPNPMPAGSLLDLQQAVIAHGADLGLAFDGDADRCFVIDEAGEVVDPSAVAAIVARRLIARDRAADPAAEIVVLLNLVTSRRLVETIEAAGAVPVVTKVGHSLIKEDMRETGAVFGGEHSGHYYFRDFFGADNGLLAALHVLAELGLAERGGQPLALSALAAEVAPYAMSGEINLEVDDVPGAYASIVEAYSGDADFDEFDGLTVTGLTSTTEPFWWFNVRPSNTEPVLRLNVEAATAAEMVRVRDAVLTLLDA